MTAYKSVVLLLLVYFWNISVAHGELESPGKKYDRPPWYIGLFWNMLGYATVIVPGAIIIRLVKNSNFNESAGNDIWVNL